MIAIHHPEHPLLTYAADELRHHLQQAFTVADAWQFTFEIDPILPAFAWKIDVAGTHATLSGYDATCVLHAVYTLLERVGYVFEITGARLNPEPDLERLCNWSITVQPAVGWRGIRQHINFPMDISSYPLAEALDYIRNVARLRFNHITFHSYPDQWYAVDLPTQKVLAGGYFYGQRYDLPDHDLIRRVVRNRNVFSIPENEIYYDQPENTPANSDHAIAWLHAVMSEAKRVGLRVQFSFEPRESTVADAIATAQAILATYDNLIDVFELISQEMGEWGLALSADELRQAAIAAFGEGVLQVEAVTQHFVAGKKELHRLFHEISTNIQVVKALQTSGQALPELVIAVYSTVRSSHAPVLAVLQQYVPEGVNFALLSDHGNRAVARNLRDLNMPRCDWERSMIYSWIEFDGTMYLFQNAVTGIYQLLQLAEDVYDTAPHAIAFNHWRTAENRTSTRYAAEAVLRGAVLPADFYHEYAQSLGIGDAARYAGAMQRLDNADTQARDELPNVGFCYAGVWGVKGLGYFGVFKRDRLQAVGQEYATALADLQLCAQQTGFVEGQKYLALVMNRVEATVVYLKAIEAAVALQGVCGDRMPDQISEAERAAVREICDRSFALMEDYMTLHAQKIEDRGCEGTLISFYHTPYAVLRRIRDEYGEGRFDQDVAAPAQDAPPSPIWEEE